MLFIAEPLKANNMYGSVQRRSAFVGQGLLYFVATFSRLDKLLYPAFFCLVTLERSRGNISARVSVAGLSGVFVLPKVVLLLVTSSGLFS